MLIEIFYLFPKKNFQFRLLYNSNKFLIIVITIGVITVGLAFSAISRGVFFIPKSDELRLIYGSIEQIMLINIFREQKLL